MSYTVDYYGGDYPLSSEIIIAKCDSCNKIERIQCLPAEHNAGEIYTANLCRACLLKLATELESPTSHCVKGME